MRTKENMPTCREIAGRAIAVSYRVLMAAAVLNHVVNEPDYRWLVDEGLTIAHGAVSATKGVWTKPDVTYQGDSASKTKWKEREEQGWPLEPQAGSRRAYRKNEDDGEKVPARWAPLYDETRVPDETAFHVSLCELDDGKLGFLFRGKPRVMSSFAEKVMLSGRSMTFKKIGVVEDEEEGSVPPNDPFHDRLVSPFDE